MIEIKRVEAVLKTYRKMPEDVCIGKNGPADKVIWLIKRLEMVEKTLKRLREPSKK